MAHSSRLIQIGQSSHSHLAWEEAPALKQVLEPPCWKVSLLRRLALHSCFQQCLGLLHLGGYQPNAHYFPAPCVTGRHSA